MDSLFLEVFSFLVGFLSSEMGFGVLCFASIGSASFMLVSSSIVWLAKGKMTKNEKSTKPKKETTLRKRGRCEKPSSAWNGKQIEIRIIMGKLKICVRDGEEKRQGRRELCEARLATGIYKHRH